MDADDVLADLSALECCNAARKIWLSAKDESDLKKVEELYLRAMKTSSKKSEQDDNGNDDVEPPKKKQNRTKPLSKKDYAKAGEKIALIFCQSGRAKKVKRGLSSLGFVCRLSTSVFDYPMEMEQTRAADSNDISDAPCMIVDNFLTGECLHYLKRIFEDPGATYWTNHEYQTEPPSPYFSYVLAMKSLHKCGFLGDLLSRISSNALLQSKFPALKEVQFVEMWAHNRPHASGHQMHFDSDDEGRGGVRNPIISTILYITAGSGGPSLITTQVLGDDHLAQKGWLCYPKEGRFVAFDGKVLHGVVPGKGVSAGRRVTLMFAFWKDIRIREEEGPGPARPFPIDKTWSKQLRRTVKFRNDANQDAVRVDTLPIAVDRIYETLEGKPWKRKMGMPSYDQVFQGF